jgi:hypothetical protein
MTSRWMTYLELAHVLKVSPNEARQWAAQAHLPKAFKAHGELVLAPVAE